MPDSADDDQEPTTSTMAQADELGDHVPAAALAARDDDSQDPPAPVRRRRRGGVGEREQAAEAEDELVEERVGAGNSSTRRTPRLPARGRRAPVAPMSR